VETNLPRNSQLETHPGDERGAAPRGRAPIEWIDFPMPWKTYPDSRRVAASSLFSVVPINSRSSLPFAAQLRRPVAVRFAFAKPLHGAAKCVVVRQGIRRSRWLAIAATSLWPPYPVFPPAIPATPARLRQRDRAAIATSAPASLPGDASALLHRCAMLLPSS
jgi:hypothetical protein